MRWPLICAAQSIAGSADAIDHIHSLKCGHGRFEFTRFDLTLFVFVDLQAWKTRRMNMKRTLVANIYILIPYFGMSSIFCVRIRFRIDDSLFDIGNYFSFYFLVSHLCSRPRLIHFGWLVDFGVLFIYLFINPIKSDVCIDVQNPCRSNNITDVHIFGWHFINDI